MLTVRYENLVQNTEQTLEEIAQFLGLSATFSAPVIHSDRVGFSKSNIDKDLYKLLSEKLEKNLITLGYD